MPRNRVPNLDMETFYRMKDVLARVSSPTEKDFQLYCGRNVSAWHIKVAKKYDTWEDFENFKAVELKKLRERRIKKLSATESESESETGSEQVDLFIREEPQRDFEQVINTDISNSISAIAELLITPKNDIRPAQSISETVGWNNSMLCIIKNIVKGIAEKQNTEMAQYSLILEAGREIVSRF